MDPPKVFKGELFGYCWRR